MGKCLAIRLVDFSILYDFFHDFFWLVYSANFRGGKQPMELTGLFAYCSCSWGKHACHWLPSVSRMSHTVEPAPCWDFHYMLNNNEMFLISEVRGWYYNQHRQTAICWTSEKLTPRMWKQVCISQTSQINHRILSYIIIVEGEKCPFTYLLLGRWEAGVQLFSMPRRHLWLAIPLGVEG